MINKENFRQISSILSHSQKMNALKLVFFILAGMFLETVGVGIIIPIIALISNDNIGGNYPFLVPYLMKIGNPSHEKLCIYAVLFLVVVYLIRSFLISYITKRESKFTFGLQETLSKKLFRTYMHQPYTFHLQRNSSELIQNVMSEVNIFVFKVISPLIKLTSEIFLLSTLSVLLLFVEPVGALSVLVLLGVTGFAIHRKTKNRLSHWGKQRQFHETQIVKHLQQGLGGIKETILLGREESFIAHFTHHNSNRVSIGQRETVTQQLPRIWIELIAVFGLAVIVWGMIFQGKPVGTIVPTLGVFAAAAFRLMPSVSRFLVAIQSIRFGLPVLKSLQKEYQLSEILPIETAKILPLQREFTIQNVSFSYPASASESLKGVSLSIKSCESIGLVGESGSGKSTLVDCILGLLTPQSGSIAVDGINIQKDLRGWQNQIGYVSQSIYLSDDTLRRNIAYGIADEFINEEAVDKAVKMSQLDKFIKTLPAGLDTIVGERGVRLSGGQRQRIGIARALYNDPLILILDEATSALDIATEREVMKSVFDLDQQKTLIIIAHRLSTVSECKKIYHMKNGLIIEEGRPEDIITKIETTF